VWHISADYYKSLLCMTVSVSEGKTLYFRATDGTTSADGQWTPVRALLHESFWFVDNSTTLVATTYDFQGDSCCVFSCFVVSAYNCRSSAAPSPLVWRHHMRHTVVQNSSGRQVFSCRRTAALEQAACFFAVIGQFLLIQKTDKNVFVCQGLGCGA